MPQTPRRTRRPRRLAAMISGGLGVLLAAALLYGYWQLRIMTHVPGASFVGPLPPATANQTELVHRLQGHLQHLAVTIGPRNVWKPGSLAETARYLSEQWQQQGYTVTVQPYPVRKLVLQNLAVALPGGARAEEVLIIGAHYDTVAKCPGADDNGSGVSALLELSRLLAGRQFDRTVRFVAFTNEEDQMGASVPMGSQVYARLAHDRGEAIVGMLSLETMGYYNEDEGTQLYPFPFSLFYPSKANFIGFVGDSASRPLLDQTIASFRQHAAFPSVGLAAPPLFSDITRSDQSSFWAYGYPGLMVTDTADFRYAHYHLPTDTVDRVDTLRLARVTDGLAQVVADLATVR